jgi:hypothetical protein
MAPPHRLLYRDIDDARGGLREDFLAQALTQAGIDFAYLKSTQGAKTPDFLIDGPERTVVEVGGKGKGRQQFKGIRVGRKVVLADTDTPTGHSIPLFLAGFLA